MTGCLNHHLATMSVPNMFEIVYVVSKEISTKMNDKLFICRLVLFFYSIEFSRKPLLYSIK